MRSQRSFSANQNRRPISDIQNGNATTKTEPIKKDGKYIIKRSNIQSRPQQQVTVPLLPSTIKHSPETIALNNKMISAVLANDPGSELIMSKNRPLPTTFSEILMVPMDDGMNVAHTRESTSRYFVNIPKCSHFDTHIYAAFSETTFHDKSIKFITASRYGLDFPIVPPCKLVYCKICMPKDHELLVKSQPRGSLNFVSSPETRSNYDQTEVPAHIPMNVPIFIDGDDVWINMTNETVASCAVDDIKDMIVYNVHRKNFVYVRILPPPFEDIGTKFDDFGTVVYVNMFYNYYDDPITIKPDTGSDIDVSDEELDGETYFRSISDTIHDQHVTETTDIDITEQKQSIMDSPIIENDASIINCITDKIENITSQLGPIAMRHPPDTRASIDSTFADTDFDQNNTRLITESTDVSQTTLIPASNIIENDNATKESSTTLNGNILASIVDDKVQECYSLSQEQFKTITARSRSDFIVFPMDNVDDFERNINYFKDRFDVKAEVAMSDNRILVMITDQISIPTKNNMFEALRDNFAIHNERYVVTLVDGHLERLLTFEIEDENSEDDDDSSENDDNASIIDYVGDVTHDLESQIKVQLELAVDSIVSVVGVILEKCYLQAKHVPKHSRENIFLSYANPLSSQNISRRDIAMYQQTSFYYSFRDGREPVNDEIAKLLINLKYCSSIPNDKIRPSLTGITILID